METWQRRPSLRWDLQTCLNEAVLHTEEIVQSKCETNAAQHFGTIVLKCKPDQSAILGPCCESAEQWRAGSLQVGLHHQEGLPGDGRSHSEFGHHQGQRGGGDKQQRVRPAAVGPWGLRLPSTGSSITVAPPLCEQAELWVRRPWSNSVDRQLCLSEPHCWKLKESDWQMDCRYGHFH